MKILMLPRDDLYLFIQFGEERKGKSLRAGGIGTVAGQCSVVDDD